MKNKENDKRKGATQNNVENDNPIANNAENDVDKKENSSPEKNGKEGKTTVGNAEKNKENIGDDEGKNKDKLSSKLQKLSIDNGATIVSGIATIYVAINYFYNLMYQIECHKFYGIPGKYFTTDIGNKTLYLLFILLGIVALVYPRHVVKNIYNQEERKYFDKFCNKFSVIAIIASEGMSLAILNLGLIIMICKIGGPWPCIQNIMLYIAQFPVVTINIVLCLSVALIILFTFYEKIKKIGFKIVFMILYLLEAVLIIYGIICSYYIKIENKIEYEFVSYQDKKYVVLSENDDKVLIASFKIDDDGRYVFYTNKYRFIDICDGVYEYRDIQSEPIIYKQTTE